MFKSFIWLIVSYIALVVLAIAFLTALVNKFGEKENLIKSKVGKTIIIGKDTAIITDYSLWMETYTLSNGSKVAIAFADSVGAGGK